MNPHLRIEMWGTRPHCDKAVLLDTKQLYSYCY
jgi:hypothetical protein